MHSVAKRQNVEETIRVQRIEPRSNDIDARAHQVCRFYECSFALIKVWFYLQCHGLTIRYSHDTGGRLALHALPSLQQCLY